ncbi:sensor histidine kinase [Clostridium grantii]|uniref:histidine kinase n=1 Tax=Clostridium grantii DSM 8605 TaxID=1121316 RepID=A0A1M5VM05_9CLOT|nr:HAMP domain-containing sensor histidine kinase [Clostridium grantii]SHH76271.1 Signal transduction histidine kinase [Clostridium grantii DSM 8605]
MSKSITLKIFSIFIAFTFSLFLFIGITTKFFLPQYYKNQKLSSIKDYTNEISEIYDANNEESINQVKTIFEEMKSTIGGDIYTLDENGSIKWSGKNKRSQEENYTISGEIFQNQFVNKMGVEIFSFGVKIDNGYLLYDVSIESLDDAVGIMINFFIYILLISLVISIISAYFISIRITKPIKKLNNLALQMKSKEIQSIMNWDRKDEIGQLNNSLNLLYEELLSNIQRLETELSKERSVEKLKKQFLAQATHELKTPISVIQGYAELIYDGMYKDENERDHYIENILNETENMGNLINDVLDFAKIENGFFSINKKQVFVNPWLNRILVTFKEFAENKDIEVLISNKVGDLCVDIDEFRIEQVIRNLLSNALKHSDKQIIINAYNLNNKLAIEVINTGKSIESTDLPYIFDSFYKAKGEEKGTGLGLAIVKQIIIQHKGDYRVENINNGVKFSFIV